MAQIKKKITARPHAKSKMRQSNRTVVRGSARWRAELSQAREEVRQRNAELAVVNSVQHALASQQDIQTTFDLVGDKLREIFDAQVVVITTFDVASNLIHTRYLIENGKRFFPEPYPPSPFAVRLMANRRSMLIRTRQEFENLGSRTTPGTAIVKSGIFVPLMVGEELRGGVSLQNIDHENAFSESDVRLLETLASSMSVALENVRLFDAERQRVAELEIINAVQQGLASKLDIQAIYDLVGDKVRDIFDLQTVMICSFDLAHSSEIFHYVYEEGQKYYPPPRQFDATRQTLIDSRQPLLFNHVTQEFVDQAGGKAIEGSQIPKSSIFAPMIVGSEVKGYISIQNVNRFDAFDESNVRLLQTLASSMSVALENAQLFDEAQHRNREITEALEQQTATSEILRVMASSLTDVQPVLDAIANNARRLLHGFYSSVYRVVGDLIDEVATSNYTTEGLRERERSYPRPLAYDSSASSRAVLDRTVLNISNILADPTLPALTHRYARALGMNSLLVVPMIREGEAIGAIAVGRRDSGAFSEKQVVLLQTFAAQAVIAIENVRLFNETKRLLSETEQRAAELQIINSVQEGLASKLEMQAIYDLVGDKLLQIFDAQGAGIGIVDREKSMVMLKYLFEDGQIYRDRSFPLGQGLSSLVIESRQFLLIDSEEANQKYVARFIFPGAQRQSKSWLTVPILIGGEAIGALNVQNFERYHAFTESDVRLLQTLASSLGVALENARLFDETQRLLRETEQRAAELAIINSMGQALAGQVELDALIQLVGDKTRETFNAHIVYVALLDRTTNLIHFSYYHNNDGSRSEPPLPLGQGLTSKIIQTREPLLINQNIQQRRQELGVTLRGTPSKSFLGVPILVGSEAIGVISVQNTETENRFDESDARLLSTIAAGVGVAIERTRLYESTQNQKQYFEGIVSNSPVAIVTVDLNSEIVEWNPAAEKLFNYTKAEVLGQHVDDLIALSDEVRAEAEACSLKAMRGELASYITRRNRRDGSFVDVQMWAVPVTVNGARVGAIALYNDISELVQARREAESANQAKSAFLATMSHEIRTPMNAVIGMSNLLLGTHLSDEQREYADIVRNSGDALLTIINDILDFSKIEAGKMELENQPFDLRECVESALDLVTTRANEKGIDLAYLIDDTVPAAIVGDGARLRQVLLNLLSNAVKFTEKGEVVVTVSPEGNEGIPSLPSLSVSSLHFAVRDTGIGILPEQQTRLFHSFSQADVSTARKYGGTGLGLAISKRLVELMHGTMWVESEGASKGSTFHFTLTVPAAHDFVPRTRAYPIGEQPALHGKRVLIVDDNATNRLILSRQLQLWGMVTQDAGSAREALAILARGDSFDLAILDLQMPEMDAIQLAQEIRKQHDATRLPLILFSSLGRRDAGEHEKLFATYITKPIKLSALFDALTNVLARGQAQSIKPTLSYSAIDPQLAARLPLRILLVEDNAVNQKLAVRILNQMGYRTDVAANGIEAIQAIERQTYDVALMDVQMPEMDGLEATRQIVARWQRGARPRIIAMTANATQGDREICLAAGMDDYIAKPIRVDDLVQALMKIGQANG